MIQTNIYLYILHTPTNTINEKPKNVKKNPNCDPECVQIYTIRLSCKP